MRPEGSYYWGKEMDDRRALERETLRAERGRKDSAKGEEEAE